MSVSLHQAAEETLKSVESLLLGKREQVELALITLFAGGHLLLEDLPGMGKTTLAQALSASLGLEHQRIQFTSDMLPADILGVSIFDTQTSQFRFHRGPVFTQLLLADEINRTTPKTQSALLEVMEEQRVSVDAEVHRVEHPFFVIATQNPETQFGTFPLPESQLDRFLMRVSLGYPSAEVEREILTLGDSRARMPSLQPTLDRSRLLAIQAECREVHAAPDLIDYLQRLLQFTRDSEAFHTGVSPRGGLALLRAARARAWLKQRKYVVPEDLQHLLLPVFAHRIRSADDRADFTAERLVQLLLEEVDVIR